MTMRRILWSGVAVATLLAVVSSSAFLPPSNAQQPIEPVKIGDSQIGDKDIGGVVTGPKGPEAGVWVIAETTDLPTRYIKSVVTDDQGRYLIPDLPSCQLPGLGARLRSRRIRPACVPSQGRA